MDVRNNLFSNQMTGGNPTTTNTRHAVVFLPSGGTSAMNLIWNNSGYYQGPATTGALSLLAQVGTTAGTGEYLAANFDPSSTGNPLNLRNYTSTLSAAGTNDNASFAVAAPPPVVSNTDLHIPPGTITPLAHGAAPGTGVTDDIDGNARDPVAPDIGADEFSGQVSPTPTPTAAATATFTPTATATSRLRQQLPSRLRLQLRQLLRRRQQLLPPRLHRLQLAVRPATLTYCSSMLTMGFLRPLCRRSCWRNPVLLR